MDNTTLGVLIMLLATSMTNVGAVLQKGAVDRLPPFHRTPLLESLRGLLRAPLWLLGWGIATAAIVLNMVALGLADISVVQPLNGFGLVVLAVFSRLYLGERLGGRALVGIALVVAGVAVVGVILPASRVFHDASRILACYAHGAAIGLLLGFLSLALLCWALARHLAHLAGVLLAFAAATCSVIGLTFAKGLFGLLAVVGPAATLTTWQAGPLLILLLVFSSAALALQQLSFQRGRAVVVTPVFASASIVLPLLVGRWVFGEHLPTTVLAGPLLIVVGVALLGLRDGLPPTPE